VLKGKPYPKDFGDAKQYVSAVRQQEK
jgi:hypothetical protein